MKITAKNVDKLTEEAAKELLKKIIEELDELDCEDALGTEGWRRTILGED